MERHNTSKRLSETQRNCIILLHNEGKSFGYIARKLNTSVQTVSKWVVRYREQDTLDKIGSPGRPPTINNDTVKQEIVEGIDDTAPYLNTTAIPQYNNINSQQITTTNNTAATTTPTVGRALKSEGLYHRLPAQKQILTQAQRKARVAFAEANLNFDFSGVIFSGSVSCGLWGWMSAGGVGEICEIDGRINSSEYVEILENVMLPSVSIVYPEARPIHFVQDNSGIHKSKYTMEWFSRHPEINLIKWPANSPDLNPIENVWGYMVKDWKPAYTRSKDMIFQHVHQKWEELRGNSELCQQLVDSLPRRLREVIDNNGYWTHY